MRGGGGICWQLDEERILDHAHGVRGGMLAVVGDGVAEEVCVATFACELDGDGRNAIWHETVYVPLELQLSDRSRRARVEPGGGWLGAAAFNSDSAGLEAGDIERAAGPAAALIIEPRMGPVGLRAELVAEWIRSASRWTARGCPNSRRRRILVAAFTHG